MDIPLVLESLRPGEDWGPCAQSDSNYARLAATWRSELSACPTLAEMLAAWTSLQASQKTRDGARAKAAAVALASGSDALGVLIRSLLAVMKSDLPTLAAAIKAST